MRAKIGLFFLILFPCLNVSAEDITFSGKVIDWETLEPIEGAVVVARWNKSRARWPDGGTDRFHAAKETLTDEKGDWTITGPKGKTDEFNKDHHRIISLILRKFYIQDPYFYIYKPGYFCNRTLSSKGPVSYWAYPYVDKEANLEGIILERRGDTMEESRAYSKKYKYGREPLIPMNDPEKKLRELAFSFQYPENVLIVWDTDLREKGIKPFRVYTVVGLRKAVTKDDRIMAMGYIFYGEGLPIATQMYRDERELFFGPDRRKAK